MIDLTLERFAAWLPGVEGTAAWRAWAEHPQLAAEPAAPSGAEIPALLRRRCDAHVRALLHVAAECCEPALRGTVPAVFASRLGPLAAVVENLETLAAGRSPSPTTFSHAVHNTALGVFSIWAQNRAPGTALAAGASTFAHGWIEAALIAGRDRTRPVLLVAGDEALPSALAGVAEKGRGPHALALLLRAGGDGPRVGFSRVPPTATGGASDETLPQPLAFLRWWLSGERALRIADGRATWIWERLESG